MVYWTEQIATQDICMRRGWSDGALSGRRGIEQWAFSGFWDPLYSYLQNSEHKVRLDALCGDAIKSRSASFSCLNGTQTCIL